MASLSSGSIVWMMWILCLVGKVQGASWMNMSPFKFMVGVMDSTLLSKRSLSRSSAHRALGFGDYTEIPATCPAMTTCPLVCVANVTFCPTLCGDGLSLCNDGVCSESCDAEIETPCPCEDLPVACAKVIDLYDACIDTFQEFYDANAECSENALNEVPLFSFTEPAFIVCYVWISAVTALVFLWCLFNQKICPVPGSVLPLTSATGKSTVGWTQTGYRRHFIGSVVQVLVVLTFVGIQFLLFLLTIFYYMQQEAITRWAAVFKDEEQVLKAFEMVWMVGFPWCFAFKYPASVSSLFLRRCRLEHATHVAVEAPMKSVEVMAAPGIGEQIHRILCAPFHCVLSLFFSYPYGRHGLVTIFCDVEQDSLNRSFYHRMRRYIYEANCGGFIPGSMSVGLTIGDFLSQVNGLSNDEVITRRGLAGPNIIKVNAPTLRGSIVKEFSKVFYLYQNFMVWTWAPYWYYYMAIVNTFVRLCSGIVVAVFSYTSDSVLYKLAHVEGEIEVLRGGQYTEISVRDVVPGDIVVIKPGTVHCDLVIVQAHQIVVDESALTGEATPVTKTELDPSMKRLTYNASLHKSNTLSAGTVVIEAREGEKDLGLVLKTGSFTTKGELLTEVLSYERHKFKFDDEVKIVLFILLLEAILLLGLVFYFLQDQWVYAWFYGAFIVGTIFPPLLPSVFVLSVGISANRLQSKRISCTNPPDILVAGKVDAAFFDKTGTLTKNGMDFVYYDNGYVGDDIELSKINANMIRLGMAVCHTITIAQTGEMLGNQVDLVAFRASEAMFDEKADNKPRIFFLGEWYSVLKRFEFDTHRATQSVIIEKEDGKRLVFVKGSPEAIRNVSHKSTVPRTYDETLRKSALSGIYQIAIGFMEFNVEGDIFEISRDDIEKSLTFGGFISYQNTMKEDAPEVLQELKEGGVLLGMITGDSVLTGICIARESGMIEENRKIIVGMKVSEDTIEWKDVDSEEIVDKPQGKVLASSTNAVDLAISGEAWTQLLRDDREYAASIAKYVRVFGRCTPTDKVAVVSTFVENGYVTLMCGDGQNDCGALKSAHVGVALSTSEASVVAPFTSLDKAISSVPEVLREGRCALASAFAAYKYYIIYGQVESYLQTINAYFAITFSDWCWVFLDGLWSITMAFSLPLSKAASRLSPVRPTASLLGAHTLFSACGILAWNFLFLVIALLTLFSQDWFQCRKWNSDDVSDILRIGDNYESSVLFVVGGYQYIASAIALNFGYTFRASWWRNYLFVLLAILWTVIIFVMTTYPSSFSCIWRVNCDNEHAVRMITEIEQISIDNPWNTTVMPVDFRWMLVGIMTANVLTLSGWEYFFVNGLLHKKPWCWRSGDVKVVERIDLLREKSVDPEAIKKTEYLQKGGTV